MLVQDILRDFKSTSGNWFHGLKFLIMFIGAVVGSLVVLIVGGRWLLDVYARGEILLY
jgi:hypothetical protein